MLTTLDRVPTNEFAITHELLAMLIGGSRPTVSIVIEDFDRKGILHAERGRLVIGNRKGLLAESCDCYQVIKENYAHVGAT